VRCLDERGAGDIAECATAATDQAADQAGRLLVSPTHQAAEGPELVGAAAADQAAEDLELVGAAAADQAAEDLELVGAAAADQAAEDLELVGAAAADQAAEDLELVGATAADQAAERCCLVGRAATDQATPRWSFCPATNIDASYQCSCRTVACVAKLDTFLAPNKFGIRGSSRKTAITPNLPGVLQLPEIRPVGPVTFMPVSRSEITPPWIVGCSFRCEEKISFPGRHRI